MVGQTIGNYRVVSRLWRGGLGAVCLCQAVDETLEARTGTKRVHTR